MTSKTVKLTSSGTVLRFHLHLASATQVGALDKAPHSCLQTLCCDAIGRVVIMHRSYALSKALLCMLQVFTWKANRDPIVVGCMHKAFPPAVLCPTVNSFSCRLTFEFLGEKTLARRRRGNNEAYLAAGVRWARFWRRL